jgi:hypothetical protein
MAWLTDTPVVKLAVESGRSESAEAHQRVDAALVRRTTCRGATVAAEKEARFISVVFWQ